VAEQRKRLSATVVSAINGLTAKNIIPAVQ
jgi:hypothetical protein